MRVRTNQVATADLADARPETWLSAAERNRLRNLIERALAGDTSALDGLHRMRADSSALAIIVGANCPVPDGDPVEYALLEVTEHRRGQAIREWATVNRLHPHDALRQFGLKP